jgi:serpin B
MSPAQVTAAENAFSLALFDRVCPSKPGSNLLLSPESAAQALGMLYAGAKGPTAAALGRLLRLPTWNPGLVAALARHTTALARLQQLTVSNHLFEQSGDRPAQRVLDDLRTAYHSGLWAVDFRNEPAATSRINGVVARETHGLIPALFQTPRPVHRTVLTNALYLKARWLYPFSRSVPAPFHTAGGRAVRVPLMRSAVPAASYRQAGGWQSATLPYAGGQLAAVAMLPPAHAATCAAPTLDQWTALTAGTSNKSTGVQLPRLHLSQTWANLQTPLAALGLPLSGDYTGLGPGDSQISEIVQQDRMDVTPAGTTAAAATGVAVGPPRSPARR